MIYSKRNWRYLLHVYFEYGPVAIHHHQAELSVIHYFMGAAACDIYDAFEIFNGLRLRQIRFHRAGIHAYDKVIELGSIY